MKDNGAPAHGLIAGASTAELELQLWVVLHELIGLSYAGFSVQGVPLAKQKHDMAQSKSSYSVLIC